MCDSAKAVVRNWEWQMPIPEKISISDLSFHLKKLEKEEQIKIKIK